MGENVLEAYRDRIRRDCKATVFRILVEVHKELIDNANKDVIQTFWKRFRLIGYAKIKCAVDLYLYQFGYNEIGPESFSRIRTADHSKHMIDIGIFLINQAYRV